MDGRFSVSIRYHGKPVTHIDPDERSGRLDPHRRRSGSHGAQRTGRRYDWFPNNNTPRDKATFDMKITVPSKLEVAGSGDLKSVRKHAGKETWRWVQPYQQATYLAMISIGDYDVYHVHA